MSKSENLPFDKPRRISRDEMNLAEFPLTVLSTRASSDTKTHEFRDSVKSKDGSVIERRWIITGADKFGLPTSSDEEVLLGLLKLTVDDGFTDRKVFFTRYELLRILRWTTEGRSYVRLQRALDRLSGVRIKASNAFYDNESKCHSTRNFGIIDAYEINDGRSTDPKPSFFSWSEVIFKSFQAGFIKKLDLQFYLDLKSAVSKRLYRYLDKHFWYKSKITHNLFLLAHEKIGISRNYKFASALRQQLDPALEELMKTGFLASFSYEGKGAETTVTMIKGCSEHDRPPPVSVDPDAETEHLRLDLSGALVQRGLKPVQAEKLLKDLGEDMLKRVTEIVRYFDSLCASQSKLVSKSPVGFLYRAIENPSQFVLPGEATKRSQQHQLKLGTVARPQAATEAQTVKRSLEAQYLVARRIKAKELLGQTEPALLKNIRSEVEVALSRIKPMVSETRYEETVQHGVEEKILKLFAFPEFQEWANAH